MAAANTNPILVLELSGDASRLLEGSARESLERSVLPTWLRSQRWFGGKARSIEAVRVIDFVPLPLEEPAALLTWLDVRFSRGANDLYLLPLAISANPPADTNAVLARLQTTSENLWLHDALTDSTVCALLLDFVAREREFSTARGTVKCETTTAFAELRGSASERLAPQLGPPTSSNSLVFYGDRLLLKLFRRLDVGINPDYEIGRYLTEQGRFGHLPRVGGAIEYRPNGDDRLITLGIVQQLVPNEADGWHHALDQLGRFYDRIASRAASIETSLVEARSMRDRDSESPPSEVAQAIQNYARSARKLGARTAELHLALACATDEPAFAPEPLSAGDLAAVRRDIGVQATQAFALLADARDRLPTEVREDADNLLAGGVSVVERVLQTTSIVPRALKTRVHGDYHLGQVLWTNGDYVILDFEGEPTRSIEERRHKFSPLRDVAGMLRSYHYAAYAGLFAFAERHPRMEARLLPWAEMWQQAISASFLTEYQRTAGDASFLPQDPREFKSLLDGFMLSKALYELSYELNNRPDWVRIPLGGVKALLA